MNNKPFVIERTFRSSLTSVWKAITDKTAMKEWFFDLESFKAEVGFEFRFTGGPSPEKQYLHVCRITEVVPQKKLTFSWQYDGYDGMSHVTFELSGNNDETTVRLTHAGLETFPQNNEDFAAKNFEAGWTEIVGTLLKKFLEKH